MEMAVALKRLMPGSRTGYSDNGWTSNELSCKYLTLHLWPHLQKRDGGVGPYLLVFDSHGSHITTKFMQFCLPNNVHPLTFPSHTSHMLQPLDVGVFKPLSSRYKSALNEFLRPFAITGKHRYMSKIQFFQLYKDARVLAFTSRIIQNAFAAAGIFPFDNRKVICHWSLVERSSSPPATPHSTKLLQLLKTPANMRELATFGCQIFSKVNQEIIGENGLEMVRQIEKFVLWFAAKAELSTHELVLFKQQYGSDALTKSKDGRKLKSDGKVVSWDDEELQSRIDAVLAKEREALEKKEEAEHLRLERAEKSGRLRRSARRRLNRRLLNRLKRLRRRSRTKQGRAKKLNVRL